MNTNEAWKAPQKHPENTLNTAGGGVTIQNSNIFINSNLTNVTIGGNEDENDTVIYVTWYGLFLFVSVVLGMIGFGWMIVELVILAEIAVIWFWNHIYMISIMTFFSSIFLTILYFQIRKLFTYDEDDEFLV